MHGLIAESLKPRLPGRNCCGSADKGWYDKGPSEIRCLEGVLDLFQINTDAGKSAGWCGSGGAWAWSQTARIPQSFLVGWSFRAQRQAVVSLK
jgi:hypothetical protein